MPEVKKFGPTYGAGTSIEETVNPGQLSPSEFGTGCVIGRFERGPVGALKVCPDSSSFERIFGGRVPFSVSPDVAQDYFFHSGGAGKLLPIRLTNGREVAASVELYSRHWGTDFTAAQSAKDNQLQVKTKVCRITALNGGRWGGRQKTLVGKMPTSVAADLTATTLRTPWTLEVNELAGATVYLAANGKTYNVVSNTKVTGASVLTVTTDATMKADADAGDDPTNTAFVVLLGAEVKANGQTRGLSVTVIDATIDPANEFGLEVRLDGVLVKTFPDLSMDPLAARYAPKVISADTSNEYIEFTDLLTAGITITPDHRPANYYGRLNALTALSATFNVAQVVLISSASVKVVGFKFHASNAAPAQRITYTWVAASNKYTVASVGIGPAGTTVDSLPDFSVGANEQLNKSYSPVHKYYVGLTVDHSASPANGSTIVVDVLPLPASAAKGKILPDAKSKPLSKFQGFSSTYNSILIDSGDLTTVGTAPALASVTGSTGTEPTIEAGVSDKVKLSVDGRKTITVTLTPGAPSSMATVRDDINAAFASAFGTNPPAPASLSSTNKLVLSSLWHEGGGPASIVSIQAVANDAYTALGLTVADTYGTAGKEARLAFPTFAANGYDGGELTDQDYYDALAPETSPLNAMLGLGLGVAQICTPDTTTTGIQQAGQAFAAAKNHMFHVIVPKATVTDQTVVDYVNTTIGRSDYSCCYFPSIVSVDDPDKSGTLKDLPNCGAIMGLWAAKARVRQGYHEPAAGENAILPRVRKLPITKAANEEVLTPQGINPIRFRNGRASVWGARALNTTATGKFLSQRLQLSHYEHTFLENYDWVIFQLNDKTLWAQLIAVFTVFFQQEFAKRALRGNKFDDAVQIKIDDENNPEASIENGDLHAAISLRLANYVERFIISISKAGVVSAPAN